MKAIIFITLVTLGFAVGAHAAEDRQERMKQAFAKRFQAADVNGDGRLSKEEAKAGMPMVYKNFDAIDTAKTGFVTPADIATYARERKAAR